jgi:hypothetical protein
MGHIAGRRRAYHNTADPLTRAVTTILYLGMLAVTVGSVVSGIRAL